MNMNTQNTKEIGTITYSPRIAPEQVHKLYLLRERMRKNGQKNVTMTRIVEEAVEQYLRDKEIEDLCPECGEFMGDLARCSKCGWIDE